MKYSWIGDLYSFWWLNDFEAPSRLEMGVFSYPFKKWMSGISNWPWLSEHLIYFVDQEENHAAKVAKEPCYTMVPSDEELNEQDSDQVNAAFSTVELQVATQ